MTDELQHAREDLDASTARSSSGWTRRRGSSSTRTTRWWWSRRWPRWASWPRSSPTRSTTPWPASAPTPACCGGSSKGADRTPPSTEQLAETDRILRMVDSEAGRCGDIVRNLLAFSRQAGARFADEDLTPVVERCRLLLNHQAEMLGRHARGARRPRPAARRLRRGAGAADAAGAVDERARGDAGRRQVSDRGAARRRRRRLVVADTGAASPRSTSSGSSSRSSPPRRSARGSASDSRSSTASSTATTARSRSTSEPGRARRFTVRLPPRQPDADQRQRAAGQGVTPSGRRHAMSRPRRRFGRAAHPDRRRRDHRPRVAGRLVQPGRPQGRRGPESAKEALRLVSGEPLRHRLPRHQDAGHGRPRTAGAARRRPTPS